MRQGSLLVEQEDAASVLTTVPPITATTALFLSHTFVVFLLLLSM
jgi:hypothetical protein